MITDMCMVGITIAYKLLGVNVQIVLLHMMYVVGGSVANNTACVTNVDNDLKSALFFYIK